MRILSYSKKTVALLLSLLVVLSSFTVLLVNVKADTNVAMAYQDPFTASGDYITADSGIAGTPIKQGFSMANSYTKGNYENRVYCLNMGNHPYSTSLDSSNSVWDQKANDGEKLRNKKTAISNIIALGLAGNMPGKVVKTFDKSNRTTSNKVITHNVYKTAKYSADGTTVRTYSDSEIYIATQLLIWEVTQGYRKIGSLNKTSKCLANAYNNTNIKTVYNYISKRIYYINKTPSFTVPLSTNPNMKVYNFKVTYNASTQKYSFSPSSRIIKSSNKGILKYYPDLAKNKSIAFKDISGNTKRLNITASISNDGDKLVLTPKSVSTNVPDEYSTNPLAFSNEKELPTGSDDNKKVGNNVIAYMPSKGQMKNGQCQVGINTDSCWIDPRKAYFKVTASYSATNVDRDFTIQKDMRIKSETSASGVKSDNSSLDSMEEGYYYYVVLPDVAYNTVSSLGEPYRYGIIKDGKVVASDPTNSQDSEEELTLSRKKDSSGNYKIYYNTELYEFYTIVGPTDSEGETQSVAKSISNYVKSGINETNMPYGNYYIYELGKRIKNVDDNSKRAYMTPSNYAIPTGINSYHYTYQEHYNALIDGTNEHNIQYKDDNNKTVNYATTTLAVRQGIKAGSLEYYQRLKRIYRGASSSESLSPTYVNLASIPVRIHKISDDGVVGKIAFKVEKKSGNNWVSVNLKNYIRDNIDDEEKKYSNYGCKLEDGILVTYNNPTPLTIDGIVREKGYTPYLDLPAGDYKITELGLVDNDKTSVTITMREYNKVPDPIVFNVGTDNSILDDFVANKTIEYEVENSSSVQLRLFKEDENGKRLNGAEFALYSDTGLQLTTSIKTTTQVINGKTEDGVAILDNLQFGTYTLVETKAPDGYVLPPNMGCRDPETGKIAGYEFTINQLGLRKGSDAKDGFYDFYNYTVTNTPTKYSFNKVDEKGNSLKGAVLQIIDSEDKIVREWTTDGNDYVLDGVLTVGKTYTLHEKSVPNSDYELAKDISFTVKETAERQVITMTDNYKRGSVTLHKTDSDGKPLAGAEFELYKADGTKVTINSSSDGIYEVANSDTNTCVVNGNGTLKVDKLRLGNYYFIETKSPDGYMTNGKKISFSITGESEITLNVDLTVPNNKSFYPDTGGNGYVIPTTIAISIIILSAIGLIALKKKTKKKEK